MHRNNLAHNKDRLTNPLTLYIKSELNTALSLSVHCLQLVSSTVSNSWIMYGHCNNVFRNGYFKVGNISLQFIECYVRLLKALEEGKTEEDKHGYSEVHYV